MNIHSIFAVPFITADLPDCAPLNAQLNEPFLRREEEGVRWRNPDPSMHVGPALFESNFELFT